MSTWSPDSILTQAKIRDKGDALATAAVEYSQSDLPTVQKGLDSFGRTAANVQEYRDAYVSTFTYYINDKTSCMVDCIQHMTDG